MEIENNDVAQVQKGLAHQINHTEKRIISLQKALQHVSDFEEFKVKGTLLKTYVNQITEWFNSVSLPDYRHPGQEIQIKLDPTKSLMENAEDYYHQYRRDKRGQETIEENLHKAQKDLVAQQKRQSQFDPEDMEQVAQLKQALISENVIKTGVLHSSKKPEPAHPRRFYTTDKVLVEVGKSSEQNDHLTLTANKNYYWMHVSELAGSHVVIHSVEPSQQTLQEAADLTAYYSKGRGLKQVPVDVLKVSQLFKPKGAKSGLVMFNGKEEIISGHPSAELAHKLIEK